MSRAECELQIGKICIVNGRGDLMMDRSKGKYIGKEVVIKRVTKGGGVICVGIKAEEVILPPKNLNLTHEEADADIA